MGHTGINGLPHNILDLKDYKAFKAAIKAHFPLGHWSGHNSDAMRVPFLSEYKMQIQWSSMQRMLMTELKRAKNYI